MPARWTALAVVLLATTGCLAADDATPTPAAEGEPDLVIDESRPDTDFRVVETGPAAAADANATLDAPPVLTAGEWWRIRFTSIFTGEDVEVVRVVAAVEPGSYLIGMPHEGWFKEAIAFHSPAFGDVAKDLSYMTHNVAFHPVRFPLVEGDSWETHFAAMPLVATVEAVDGVQATVTFRSPPSEDPMHPAYVALGFASEEESMRLVYDASVHEVVRFESSIGVYEVVEHGYDYEGWVTIPRGHDTAIDYGNLGPVTPGEPPVTREILVDGGFNRMTLMHGIFPLSPGAYRIESTAPDGTTFTTESVGASTFTLEFYEIANPDGTWTATDVVAGVGGTYSMGIAYHQYDIRLPDGLRRSDHSHAVVR